MQDHEDTEDEAPPATRASHHPNCRSVAASSIVDTSGSWNTGSLPVGRVVLSPLRWGIMKSSRLNRPGPIGQPEDSSCHRLDRSASTTKRAITVSESTIERHDFSEANGPQGNGWPSDETPVPGAGFELPLSPSGSVRTVRKCPVQQAICDGRDGARDGLSGVIRKRL